MSQSTFSPQSIPSTVSAPQRAAAPDPAPDPGQLPDAPVRTSILDTPPDFPGCESFRMTLREFERTSERLEFWDARTETAWKVRDVYLPHEVPTHRLTWLVSRIASVRGSPIDCYGSVSLTRLEETGRRRWVMQADQIVFLNWARSRPEGRVIRVGEDALPDVVLEVDHTTDVRRWKLKLYQECGFPEIWVSVPDETSVRKPGLTIHLRDGDGYHVSGESRAFPGWRTEEIHRALTEAPLSGVAWRSLERVGRAMGAREGTCPDDDPLTRSLTGSARKEGRIEGREQGRAEGLEEGRNEGLEEGRAEGCRGGRLAERMDAVRAVLRARGIETGADIGKEPELLAGPSLETVMAAALACTDEADFRRRLGNAPT